MITLAMPVYNVEKYVRDSLLSALNQTYQDMEFIVVDDKGTDRSMDIVREVVATHPRGNKVRIIDHGTNRGLGDTRNTSIDNAKGEFIYFMDSDDIITPDCIEKLAACMNETPVDFVAASRELRYFDGKHIQDDVYSPATVRGGELAVAEFRYTKSNRILGEVWNKLYSVDFLRRNNIRCIPGVHVEDVSFSFQCCLKAHSCRLIPDITYTYRIYEGQSFAAFQNNRQRALYLADCFCKIRETDLEYAKEYRNSNLYPDLLIGIYSVAFLHSEMIFQSTQLTRTEKDAYLDKLLNYPLKVLDIFKTEHNKKKHFIIFFLDKCPIFIRTIIYKKITRFTHDYEGN